MPGRQQRATRVRQRAKGQFLAFTDDDCRPAADWLQALAQRFATAPDHAVGGRTVNALTNNPYTTASQLIVDFVYAYYNADSVKHASLPPTISFSRRTAFTHSAALTQPSGRQRTAIFAIAGCTRATI
jgi:hypothetical protein